MMNDNDFDVVHSFGSIEVQEEDKRWRPAEIFKHKRKHYAVVYFGKQEYEGLDGSYQLNAHGKLVDGDGDEIKWRKCKMCDHRLLTKPAPLADEHDNAENNLVLCGNCDEEYRECDNNDGACIFYEEEHLGTMQVNWEHDFWYNWNEARGDPDGDYCREEYGDDGGYTWTGCGCSCGDNGECERQGRHVPVEAED
jgi:hypothetical protein